MLRVMTWNVWWQFGPWRERQRAIEATIAGAQPDVVCLQEVWSEGRTSLARLLADHLGANCALSEPTGPEGDRVGFHNAIVSRFPLGEVESLPLPGAGGYPGARRVLLAGASTPWGRWPLACTHLAYRFDESALRLAQVRALLAMVDERRGDPEQDLPLVLCGDLNAVPDSDEIRLLTGRSPGRSNLVFSDAWEQVGAGPGHTWRHDNPYQADTAWPNRRLDYVMVSWPRPKPAGNPQRAWLAGVEPVDGVMPSDHAAVVVDLRTP